VRSDEACSCPEAGPDPGPGAADGKTFEEQLRDAVAESAADTVEQAFREIDDLSDGQVARLVANLPDLVKGLVAEPLGRIARAAGAPVPAAAFGTDVSGTLLLDPVLEPLGGVVHAFEVAGIVVGLVTGLHPLMVICAQHLAHDSLGSVLAAGARQVMTSAGAGEARPEVPAAGGLGHGSGSDAVTVPGRGDEPLSPVKRQVDAVRRGWLGNGRVPKASSRALLAEGEATGSISADDDDGFETLSCAAGLADTGDDPTDLGSAI
jgi:hypothetical protein